MSTNRKITIEDIAKDLNISKTTVSFILNGKGKEKKISKVMQTLVLDYVDRVGYKPNQFARGLRTGKTNMIAVLVEDISDPFFAKIVRAIEDRAYKEGYRIVCSSTENSPEKTKEFIRAYRSGHQVDGYIIAPPPGIEDDIRGLIADHLPVVLFDRYFPTLPTDSVVVDNFHGAYDAMQYFYQCGHKKVGFITLQDGQMQMEERLRGYMRATDEFNGQYLVKKVAFDGDRDRTVEEVRSFLEANEDMDGIFFATNYFADAGLEAIQSLGRSMPGDLGVVVFDDFHSFRLINPAITAVEQPVTQISTTVIRLMLDKLAGLADPRESKTIVLPTRLIIRKSTRNSDLVRQEEQNVLNG